MVLMLAAAAAGGLLLRWFARFRGDQPEKADHISANVQGAAVMVGAVAQVVGILLKALWGTPSVSTSTPGGMSRIATPVGEAA